jgi:diguanylate cyclase (GGDEF)-like protein
MNATRYYLEFLRYGVIFDWSVVSLTIGLGLLSWWLGKQYDKAKFFSEKDYLTGVYNRRFVEEKFPKLVALSERQKQQLAIFVIDLNNFKQLNDTVGHHSGDKALKLLATILEINTRQSDIVARWGGDEFLIIAPVTDLQGAKKIRAKIEEKVNEELKKYLQVKVNVGVSIGIALYPDDAKSFDELLKVADKNMYELKIHQRR